MALPNPKLLAGLTGLIALYLLLAKGVLLLFGGHAVVSFLWPASGIALALVLLHGYRLLPAVFLGTLLGYLLVGASFPFALMAALRHALAIFLGLWLLKREGHFDPSLRTLGDYLRVMMLALVVGLLTVLFMTMVTWLDPRTFQGSFSFNQRLAGHVLGILVFMPLVLVWRQLPRDWFQGWERMVEAALILGLTFLVGQVVFIDWLHDTLGLVARGYWLFLFITWAAVRLGAHGAVLVMALVAVQGILGAQWGVGFFSNDIARTQLSNYFYYTLCLSTVGMSLASYFTGREDKERILRQWANAFEFCAHGMVIGDSRTNCYTACNPAFERIAGRPEGEIIGQPILRLFDPSEHGRLAQFIRETLERGWGGYESNILRPDGALVPVQVDVVSVRDAEGQPLYRVATVQDITQKQQVARQLEQYHHHLEDLVRERTEQIERLNTELQRRADEAERANRAKSVFLSNMSHELRTPLNAILGFAQIMERDGETPPHQRNNLATINRSGRHLLALINDVLEISRIEAGRTRVQNEAFDLHECITAVTEMIRLRAQGKGLELVVTQGADLPRHVLGDAHHLRQVLINLLGNGVKFTDQGQVGLDLRIEGAGIRFEVRDSGPGIAAADQGCVFDAFYQTANGVAKGEGTGLGLTISRELIRSMGGELTLASEPGQGSRFSFTLPLPVTQAPEGLARPRQVLGLEPGQPEYRILVADDHPDNRDLIAQLLDGAGFRVRLVEDGQQAVAALADWRPHFIWMDMRMPVMDGYAATRAIRALPGGERLPIVALTASAFSEDRPGILAAGCNDLVGKPLQPQEIFACLERYLGVRFRYGEEQAPAAAPALDHDLADGVRQLPDPLRQEMRRVALELDFEGMQGVIARVAETDPRLAERLGLLLEQYSFEELIGLAGAEEGPSGVDQGVAGQPLTTSTLSASSD